MIILGIDPGTAATGWGVIATNGGGYKVLGFGVIRTQKTLLSKKYTTIFEELEKVIAEYKPDAVSIETQFVYKNAQSALKIGMARAMGILAAGLKNIAIYEYAPKSAKLAATGSGSASKESVIKMISLLLNISKSIPSDAADALALAICHGNNRNCVNLKQV